MKIHKLLLFACVLTCLSTTVYAKPLKIAVDSAPVPALVRLLATEFSKNVSVDSSFSNKQEMVSFTYAGESLESALTMLCATNDYHWYKTKDGAYVVSKYRTLAIKKQAIDSSQEMANRLRTLLSLEGSYVLGPDSTLVVQDRPSRITMLRAAFQEPAVITEKRQKVKISLIEETTEESKAVPKTLYSDIVELSSTTKLPINHNASSETTKLSVYMNLKLTSAESGSRIEIKSKLKQQNLKTKSNIGLDKESVESFNSSNPITVLLGDTGASRVYLKIDTETTEAIATKAKSLSSASPVLPIMKVTAPREATAIDPKRVLKTHDTSNTL